MCSWPSQKSVQFGAFNTSCITKEAYAFIVNQLKISETVSCKYIYREIQGKVVDRESHDSNIKLTKKYHVFVYVVGEFQENKPHFSLILEHSPL